jgi:phosphoesterase RecJ-like protein
MKAMNYPRLEKDLSKLYRLIKKSKSLLIAGHINPDGDNIASQLALGEFLKSYGKKFTIALCEELPKQFQFLPNVSWVQNIKKNPIVPEDYDLVIIVDSGDIDRIGEIKDFIRPYHTIVNIDHHKGNKLFGSFNLVLEKASSIGEILYYFFRVNKIDITYDMAVELYVSILSDTGSFRYDSMHQEVHLIAADLLSKGVVPAEFNISLYQNKTLDYIRLLALILSRIGLFENDKIAVSYLNFEDFNDGIEQETDGMIEYVGMLDTVSVYLMIKEKQPGLFTASLRSKYHVDVALVASAFGGGGHIKAAGCKTQKLGREEFRNSLIEEIKKQL